LARTPARLQRALETLLGQSEGRRDPSPVAWLDLEKSLPVFSEIKAQYVNTSAPPASTTVQVSKLTRGALLEVEVIASLPPVA
jgi:enamine deaminase RidA (YjgF/YER057c/UK114 family)